MTETDLRQAILRSLREAGHSPSIDSDGDITLRYEGRSFCVVFDRKDRHSAKVDSSGGIEAQ